jgi:mannose-6-phosphate isomerase-like protein (cupin superfamily)
MSDFTITNFKQINDAAGPRMPGIEARFAREHLNSEHLGVTYVRYQPGVRSPMAHSHRTQEEAYIVIGGSGTIVLNEEPHSISRWDVIRVSPSTVRTLEAGADGLELIAVGSDRPEGGDAVPGGRTGPGEDS